MRVRGASGLFATYVLSGSPISLQSAVEFLCWALRWKSFRIALLLLFCVAIFAPAALEHRCVHYALCGRFLFRR